MIVRDAETAHAVALKFQQTLGALARHQSGWRECPTSAWCLDRSIKGGGWLGIGLSVGGLLGATKRGTPDRETAHVLHGILHIAYHTEREGADYGAWTRNLNLGGPLAAGRGNE